MGNPQTNETESCDMHAFLPLGICTESNIGTAYNGEDVVKKKERLSTLDSIGILDIYNVRQLILLCQHAL